MFLCDFGLSRKLLGGQQSGFVGGGGGQSLPVRWMSPEALIRGEYSRATDVWMFGVFVWELFALEMPFNDIFDGAELAGQGDH